MNTYTEAYEFLLSVIENIPYGVISISLEGNITMINEKALEYIAAEVDVKNILGTNILDHVEDIEGLADELVLCFEKRRHKFEVNEYLYNDRHLNINGMPILNGMLLSINDITENKQAQDAATLALLKAQEQERRRLAQEIHDGIGPLMSTIRLNLDAVKNELGDLPDKTLNKVNAMGELIQNVATDIRQISHALMPSALIDFGLPEALKSLSEKVTHSEILTVNFYHTGTDERFERKVELNLYRCAQELLNNSIKYAEAKTINIQLVQHNDMILLTVEDDGIGFDQNKIDYFLENGIGLRNINTRVTSLNGIFSIDTQKGKGVISTVEIPLTIATENP